MENIDPDPDLTITWMQSSDLLNTLFWILFDKASHPEYIKEDLTKKLCVIVVA